jgi:opacity protein-like surface antigen
MRRDFLFGIGLLASVGAGAGSALAADMPVRPVGPPPAAAPATCCAVPDWTGFYVGIHGGGGGGRTTHDMAFFDTVNTPFFFSRPNTNPSGGVFGFQWGYNWQWGPAVGGLEIDFSGADIKESTTFFDPFFARDSFHRDFKIDELASARGRLGYLIFPNWLLYGTAGIGWGHTRIDTTAFDVRFPAFFASQRSEINEFGWVVGAGLEWKFWNNWLLRGEWLHYDFGRTNHFDLDPIILNNGTIFQTAPVTIRTSIDVGRVALSYKF